MEQKIIEQVFKDAFEEFSPDVSPKVWGGISQQLAQPVAPPSAPSGSLVKMAAAKLGTASTWIIGGIAVTAITAGVLMYEHKVASNKEVAIVSESTIVMQNKHDENLPANASPVIVDSKQADNIPQNNKPIEKEIIRNTAAADKITNDHVIKDTRVNDETANIENGIVSQKTNSANAIAPQKENQSSTNDLQSSANSNTNNTIVADKVAPLILINATAGFAPLQVACLLNKESLNGDWEFGDGTSQLRSNTVNHKYTKPGTYTLQCTSDETVITKTIEVIGQISTVFSPNGDGVNDYFYIDATNLKTLSLRIFDRNGRKMGELNNPDEKWDGRIANGAIAETGTYFYELNAVTENGKEIKQRGSVNLFR